MESTYIFFSSSSSLSCNLMIPEMNYHVTHKGKSLSMTHTFSHCLDPSVTHHPRRAGNYGPNGASRTLLLSVIRVKGLQQRVNSTKAHTFDL